MPAFFCRKCNIAIFVPHIDEALKTEIAKIARQQSVVMAIERLNSATQMGFRDSKAVGMHITKKPGVCSRCGQQLDRKQGNCPKCGAVNLDW
jgi:predicted Zn-ribbon and HTH transcriptional regulator